MQELMREEAEFLKYNTLSNAANFNKYVSNEVDANGGTSSKKLPVNSVATVQKHAASEKNSNKYGSSETDFKKYVGSPQIVSDR
jgi:hypothetical protein